VNPDLERWIDEASKGLEPLAREKITEQITEHYQDAVAGYRSSGLGEVDACSKAIGDLGKSKEASKRYSKVFFTERELKNGESRHVYALYFFLSPLFFSRYTFDTFNQNNNIIYLVLLLCLIVSMYLIKLVLKGGRNGLFYLIISEVLLFIFTITTIWFDSNLIYADFTINLWFYIIIMIFAWSIYDVLVTLTKLNRRAQALSK